MQIGGSTNINRKYGFGLHQLRKCSYADRGIAGRLPEVRNGMNEELPEPDPRAISEDIATLYSQAHLQGTRYWDFSASRKQVQGQFRRRIAREHAERAGVEASTPVRSIVEPGYATSFQSPQSQSPAFEPLRSGPILASDPAPDLWVPEPAPQAEAHEIHEITNSRSSGTQPSGGPQREPQPQTRAQAPTRWYALHSVFEPERVPVPPAAPPISFERRPPMVAVFSLAGGVGKTCLVANLGRALSAFGEQVLLVDTADGGLLPFYFGSRASRPGIVRTFSPPSFPVTRPERDVPVRMLNLQGEQYPADDNEQDPLVHKLVRAGRGVSRILVDVATASWEVTSRLLVLGPAVLVPILPDMNSVASLGTLEILLAGQKAFYLLNQFDPSSALHLAVRETLEQRLGDRLLPFVLHRNSAVSEALAEGMTVIDYAPGAAAAEDYRNLATWLRSFAAPAAVGDGGVRWSER
jgi:cellulose synthase operon protein YhjQ